MFSGVWAAVLPVEDLLLAIVAAICVGGWFELGSVLRARVRAGGRCPALYGMYIEGTSVNYTEDFVVRFSMWEW